jgi:orotate phosphoribosyltransferase
VRSGKVITQMVELIRQVGAEVVAVGSLVHFKGAHLELVDVPYYSLLDVDTQFDSPENCPLCKAGEPLEKVWV